ncbi:MAG TPA: NTP transferase domain-containing protein [Candidatus Eisenbacteria bacterium]|nr:NTP transferase domain-containing protein [Candidatus Eisenbacteria bacterium]
MRVAGLILAAGSASRFGAPKALARFDGRPLLEHSLVAARAAGLEPIVVVLGAAADSIEAEVAWAGERRLRNPSPGRGLASSLAIGIDAVAGVDPPVDVVVVLLGDQPRTDPVVIRSLVSRYEDGRAVGAAFVVPRYAAGSGANPVLVARSAFGLAREARGDRGLGPLIEAHPELVLVVPVDGDNPDVDTPADLVGLVEASWAGRVRANREQVERVREVPQGTDFYRPVSSLFRADPQRTDDPVLAALQSIVRPDDVVLDIGAGAGRYALPLACAVREVIALDPSPAMLVALREAMAEFGVVNIRPIEGRWPLDPAQPDGAAGRAALGPLPVADVALIAHVGYDVEAIGPFLDAMEAAARRTCVAVLMERSPGAIAAPFWPDVHGEERVALPALASFVELLIARGKQPQVRLVETERRRWTDRRELETFLRDQTWTAPGSERDGRLTASLDRRATVELNGGVSLGEDSKLSIGVVVWSP